MSNTFLQKTRRRRGNQSKHWCYTINNPKDGDSPSAEACKSLFAYSVAGKEVGKNGTPHIQGYCILFQRKRLSAMKKLFPTAHLEIMKGTPIQASIYCKKDGKFEEFGTLPKTAAQASSEINSAKWENAWTMAKAGTIEDIGDAWIRVSSYGALKRIQQDYPQPVEDLPDVCGIWIWGKSGTGKSHIARKMWSPFYDKPCTKWWCGYRGQANVIIDDIDKKHASWIGSFLKRWADKYSFPNEHKGSGGQIRPKQVVCTSQYSLEQLFDGKELEALQRRFVQLEKLSQREVFREYFQRTRAPKTPPPRMPTPSFSSDELSDSDDDTFDLNI